MSLIRLGRRDVTLNQTASTKLGFQDENLGAFDILSNIYKNDNPDSAMTEIILEPLPYNYVTGARGNIFSTADKDYSLWLMGLNGRNLADTFTERDLDEPLINYKFKILD